MSVDRLPVDFFLDEESSPMTLCVVYDADGPGEVEAILGAFAETDDAMRVVAGIRQLLQSPSKRWTNVHDAFAAAQELALSYRGNLGLPDVSRATQLEAVATSLRLLLDRRRRSGPAGLSGSPADGIRHGSLRKAHPFEMDSRTMWAWHEWSAAGGAVAPDIADRVLQMLVPGEMVEAVFEAVTEPSPDDTWYAPDHDTSRTIEMFRYSGSRGRLTIAFRTWSGWIFVPTGEAASAWRVPVREVNSAYLREDSYTRRMGTHLVRIEVDGSWRSLATGFGQMAMRLPDIPGVPDPPDPAVQEPLASAELYERKLVVDWRAAEATALDFVRANGFPSARLTSTGRDGGIDVVGPDLACQVKHQGTAVSAPVIHQLRGAAPDSQWCVFFSTAGYTSAARMAAERVGVALFAIDEDSAVRPLNKPAVDFVEAGLETAAHVGPIHRYCRQVRDRVEAVIDWSLDFPGRPMCACGPHLDATLDDVFAHSQYQHAMSFESYLDAAERLLEDDAEAPENDLAKKLILYRHVDLLAAAFVVHGCGMQYPLSPVTQESASEVPRERGLFEFYS